MPQISTQFLLIILKRENRINMRLLIISTFILLINSCSQVSMNQKIENANFDALKEESFMRYSSNRLNISNSSDIQKGLIECHSGDHSSGIDIIKSKYQEKKNNPTYWNNLGNCFFLSQDYYKALWSYNIAVSKTKKFNIISQNNIAVIMLNQNKTKEAIGILKNVVSKSRNLAPKFNLAHSYLELGLLKSSNKIFRELYKYNKQDIDFVHGLALTETLSGRFKDSQKIISSIDYKDRDDFLLISALNNYSLGNYSQAQEILEQQGLILSMNVKRSSKRLSSLIEKKIEEIEKRRQPASKQ